MRLIEGLLWDKHVTLGELGVGLIPLLQDWFSVIKVYPEVCT